MFIIAAHTKLCVNVSRNNVLLCRMLGSCNCIFSGSSL